MKPKVFRKIVRNTRRVILYSPQSICLNDGCDQGHIVVSLAWVKTCILAFHVGFVEIQSFSFTHRPIWCFRQLLVQCKFSKKGPRTCQNKSKYL